MTSVTTQYLIFATEYPLGGITTNGESSKYTISRPGERTEHFGGVPIGPGETFQTRDEWHSLLLSQGFDPVRCCIKDRSEWSFEKNRALDQPDITIWVYEIDATEEQLKRLGFLKRGERLPS